MTIEEIYQLFKAHRSVQTDTRNLKAGDLFFALKGDRFNGNKFAAQAIDAGAAYAVIDEAEYEIPGKTILVDDVLSALQALAAHHRRQFKIPFLAITGSNGKTTTKELVNAVLAKEFKTSTTVGNLNNHIGIPLTLLRIPDDAELAIIEMGANHQKEIAGYCEYTMPTHGLITNCGKAHLEGFGGVEGIRKGKGELFDYLREHDGTAFIMQDYDYLLDMSKGIRERVFYGTGEGNRVRGTVKSADPFLTLQLEAEGAVYEVETQLVGGYNLPNILAAASVADYFRVGKDNIRAALETYTPSNSRSQLLEKDGNRFILDAYNANPSSMKLAVENMAEQPAAKKILLLGAMAELGPESLQEHQDLLSLIQKYSWEQVVLVGGDFRKIRHPYLSFQNAEEARDWWQQQSYQDALVLIKGSRSMHMETVLEKAGS